MKKILLAALLGSLASASFADVEDVCTGTTATTFKVEAADTPASGTADTRFIKSDFNFNCSANSILLYEEQGATLLTVGAASVKGNEYFGGHTDGGAVTSYGKCADSKGCVTADATTGNTEAKEKADATSTGGGDGD